MKSMTTFADVECILHLEVSCAVFLSSLNLHKVAVTFTKHVIFYLFKHAAQSNPKVSSSLVSLVAILSGISSWRLNSK